MVAQWRHGAYRVVGLEFHTTTPELDPARLAPHLSRLPYLEFVKMPRASREEFAAWSRTLPGDYSLVHCAP